MAVWFMSSSLESKGITSSSGFRVLPRKIFLKKREVYSSLFYKIKFG